MSVEDGTLLYDRHGEAVISVELDNFLAGNIVHHPFPDNWSELTPRGREQVDIRSFRTNETLKGVSMKDVFWLTSPDIRAHESAVRSQSNFKDHFLRDTQLRIRKMNRLEFCGELREQRTGLASISLVAANPDDPLPARLLRSFQLRTRENPALRFLQRPVLDEDIRDGDGKITEEVKVFAGKAHIDIEDI